MNRIFFLMALVIFLSGCRIDAAVVGEGRVASLSGSIDCSTGNVGDCTEKYLTSGAETFLAEPAPGWIFSSWKNCSYTGLQQCRTVFDQSLADISGSWRITAIFHPINPSVQEASYTYNSLGQRITKSVGAKTTVFQYDLDGNLIAELDSAGQPLRQHIYLNNQPIAQVSKRGTDVAVHYVHTDHLGTPALLTDQSRIVVGDFEVTPFGETFSEYTEVEYYKRFPGQYKDMETGLHYNYFRDYDPSLGRYIQSDPVGLSGGVNTYGYTGSNPLMYIDLFGLDKTIWFNSSGGRNVYLGPTNGNWGGQCWSGGQNSCGEDGLGEAKPVDSLDACNMNHDVCWAECQASSLQCDLNSTVSRCKDACDAAEARCLLSIDTVDPKNWPKPPPKGTEADSIRFQHGAIFLAERYFLRHKK